MTLQDLKLIKVIIIRRYRHISFSTCHTRKKIPSVNGYRCYTDNRSTSIEEYYCWRQSDKSFVLSSIDQTLSFATDHWQHHFSITEGLKFTKENFHL